MIIKLGWVLCRSVCYFDYKADIVLVLLGEHFCSFLFTNSNFSAVLGLRDVMFPNRANASLSVCLHVKQKRNDALSTTNRRNKYLAKPQSVRRHWVLLHLCISSRMPNREITFNEPVTWCNLLARLRAWSHTSSIHASIRASHNTSRITRHTPRSLGTARHGTAHFPSMVAREMFC